MVRCVRVGVLDLTPLFGPFSSALIIGTPGSMISKLLGLVLYLKLGISPIQMQNKSTYFCTSVVALWYDICLLPAGWRCVSDVRERKYRG